MTTDCWGTGSFDNLAAHDVCFQLVTSGGELSDVVPSTVSSESECQKLVAIGELINALNGHLDAVAGCPMVAEWVAQHSSGGAARELKPTVLDRLKEVAKTSKLKRYWEKRNSRSLKSWLENVDAGMARLADTRKGRKKKLPPLGKKGLISLVKKEWPGREPGVCLDVYGGKSYRGYDQLEVTLQYTDISTALEMTRSRSVIGLQLWLETKDDDEEMLVPMKLLLRGWWNLLRWVRVDVPDNETRSDLLKGCLWELANLPALEVFDTVSFVVDDAVVEAVSKNPELQRVDISNGDEITSKTLKYLSSCPNLRELQLWNSKITAAKAKAFTKAHPNLRIGIR